MKQSSTQRNRLVSKVLLLLLLIIFLSACLQFDAPDANLNATISALEAQVDSLSTQEVRQDEFISYLATLVWDPNPGGPPTLIPTYTPYHPIIGGVLIEDGACCVGGTTGETIEVEVIFEARNIEMGKVTEMRTLAGGMQLSEVQMQDAEWEPYVSTKTFPVQVFINWIGFYVCVQFRDVEGNLSDVMCDDISVEGAPADPTP
ncbi:MAG: hypothetical protein MUO76_22260 [Anaerolineaceae bacterium]|nr:hypothetical protein [Anaerolineaceae bacterium]